MGEAGHSRVRARRGSSAAICVEYVTDLDRLCAIGHQFSFESLA